MFRIDFFSSILFLNIRHSLEFENIDLSVDASDTNMSSKDNLQLSFQTGKWSVLTHSGELLWLAACVSISKAHIAGQICIV